MTSDVFPVHSLPQPEWERQVDLPLLRWLLELWHELDGGPVKRWEAGDESRDDSGVVLTDYDSEFRPRTVGELLGAYTGAWSPTFVSGAGRAWNTHEDEWEQFLWERYAAAWDRALDQSGLRDLYPDVTGDDLLDRSLVEEPETDWASKPYGGEATTIDDLVRAWADLAHLGHEFDLAEPAAIRVFADRVSDWGDEPMAMILRHYAEVRT